MDQKNRLSNWLESENRQKSFEGWDFSSIQEDFWQEEISWNYTEIVKYYLKPNMRLLDMGTGGGELLTLFSHPFHQTSVTEGWEKNYQLLLMTLAKKGVEVKFVKEDDQLDFSDNQFDIVLNSHESFSLDEVKRVLKPGGLFITQQVGDLNGINLASRLIPNFEKKDFNLHLSSVVRELKKRDFDILDQYESYPSQKFFSMDALIYYVRTIEWEFPGFSVLTLQKELIELEEELKRVGFIYNQVHRFLVSCINQK
ncbi:class I SAM-dependent methyltransferase [Vagococcus carniphilus]|uniref:class I SAM-dependent methyltransferase n=1 Tax=Vagococcus carniphilus TaxID=218144 RepID=UPI00288D40BE|nr:class I SAM-dependent methyltransferase [Vagococcus carniphilus]MDT2849929.1 class I SAM-dependent methyltransferase [Vagococcus carniphilus]